MAQFQAQRQAEELEALRKIDRTTGPRTPRLDGKPDDRGPGIVAAIKRREGLLRRDRALDRGAAPDEFNRMEARAAHVRSPPRPRTRALRESAITSFKDSIVNAGRAPGRPDLTDPFDVHLSPEDSLRARQLQESRRAKAAEARASISAGPVSTRSTRPATASAFDVPWTTATRRAPSGSSTSSGRPSAPSSMIVGAARGPARQSHRPGWGCAVTALRPSAKEVRRLEARGVAVFDERSGRYLGGGKAVFDERSGTAEKRRLRNRHRLYAPIED